MRSLVIHADDFGLSPSVNAGILSAIQNGVVRSTSMLVNFPAAEPAAVWAKQYDLDVGWHVNLVQGAPLLSPRSIPSLVDGKGMFLSPRRFVQRALLRRLNSEDLRRELSAQLHFFLDRGLKPSHLDGHLHMHVMPPVAAVLQALLKENPIPYLRSPREPGGLEVSRWPARFFLGCFPAARRGFWNGAKSLEFYGLSLSTDSHLLEAWEKLLGRIKEECAEIMVHPALSGSSEESRLYGSLQRRQEEHDLLIHPALRGLLQRNGFQWVGFRDLLSK